MAFLHALLPHVLAALLVLVCAPILFTSNEAQAVLNVDQVQHAVRAYDKQSTLQSASFACTTLLTTDIELCTVQLEQKLTLMLDLQDMARNRYPPLVQFWWMSSIMVRTEGGNLIIQYLPLLEQRATVMHRFVAMYQNEFTLFEKVPSPSQWSEFINCANRPMDAVANRRILLLSLVLSSCTTALLHSFYFNTSPHPLHVEKGGGATAAASTATHTTRPPMPQRLVPARLGQVRLLLAYAVVAFHSMEMTSNTWLDPMSKVFSIDLGTFAAAVTHAISGFLSHAAIHRHGSTQFLVRRVKRLWPAFLFLGLLSVFVLGPLVTGNAWYAFSRSGRRVFWWCVSGEFLLAFGDAIDAPLSFEIGEILVRESETTVGVALWSMPQLALCWVTLAVMHFWQGAHLFPLCIVTLSTTIAAGTGKDIYIAAFFWGATCSAAASHTHIPIHGSTGRWSVVIFGAAAAGCCRILPAVHAQLWKLGVVLVFCAILVWCREEKATTNTHDPMFRNKDVCGSFVLGTYVFGSDVQSALATVVGRSTQLSGIAGPLFNFCLTLPLLTLCVLAFSFWSQTFGALLGFFVSLQTTKK